MSVCLDGLPLTVGLTAGWSCEETVDNSPDVGELRVKELKIQELADELLHLA